jgi:misacylated tRNA(Ala) deacylase
MSAMLFQTDSYLKEFDFLIEEVLENENAVILDRTAFYPSGGGQPCDIGKLIIDGVEYEVSKVKKAGGKILHYIKGELPKKESSGNGIINWENRYKLMRTHTAMHILCGVIWRDYKSQVTGGNMEPLKARMDFEFEGLERDRLQEIEDKVNAEIKNQRNIKVNILSREEAFKIPDLIRTKINLLPEGIKEIRTIEIEGLDLQADGGTHVGNTKEVGKMKIVDYRSKGKINKRLYVEIED